MPDLGTEHPQKIYDVQHGLNLILICFEIFANDIGGTSDFDDEKITHESYTKPLGTSSLPGSGTSSKPYNLDRMSVGLKLLLLSASIYIKS